MKIYRIISDLPDGRFLCYIGSTSRDLKKRLKGHKSDYYNYLKGSCSWITSFELIKKNWYEIVLIEDLGNCSKSYCLDKEAYYINHYKKLSDEYLVVNKCNPNGLDILNQKKVKKIYRQTEKFKAYQKEYQQKSEKYKTYQKEYNKNRRKNLSIKNNLNI